MSTMSNESPNFTVLGAEEKALFNALADQLIPHWDKLPAMSETNVVDEWLPRAIRVREDLLPGFRRALSTAGSRDFQILQLHAIDPEAFEAFATLAAGSYLMAPEIKELIGYPGQEARQVSADYDLPYFEMLEAVVERASPVRQP